MKTPLHKQYDELLGSYRETQTARDEILKSEELSADQLAAVKSHNATLADLHTKLEDLQALIVETERLDLATLKGVGKDPATTHASVLGVTPEKSVQVQTGPQGPTILDDDAGAHYGLSEKTARAIAEPGYKAAFRDYCRRGAAAVFSGGHPTDGMSKIDIKVLQEGDDGSGGVLVPMDMLNRIIQKTAAPTRVAGRVTTIFTGRDSVSMPRVVYTTDNTYTTGIRISLTGERPASSTAHRVNDPVFGETRINIGTWMMSMPITNDLVEDANFPLLTWASSKFQEAVDQLFDDQILNGSATGAYPQGIFLNPGGTDQPSVTLSSTASNIDADQLRGMPFDLPEQYITASTVWVMQRSTTGRKVALFKDADNRYLFQEGQTFPGLQDRSPDTLVGYPIAYSVFAPAHAAQAYPLLFGDLSGYIRAIRTGFSIRILQERYAEDNQIVMLGRLRWGGHNVEPFRMQIGRAHNA